MSNRYKGGVISATPPTTTGGEDGTASGAWTLEQQMQLQAAGLWPAQPTGPYIEQVFSTYLYTGTGAAQTITNNIDLSTKGGLVWMKSRTSNPSYQFNVLVDTARAGILISNTTDAASGSGQTTYNTNGFTINAGYTAWNSSGQSYASWTFRKQPKFFDVVTWTGDGTGNINIPHNLGSVPGCIMLKKTSAALDWYVYHRDLNYPNAGSPQNNTLKLNTTDAGLNSTAWQSGPTSTYFPVLGSAFNVSGATYVAYLFAHDAGGFGLTGTDNVISCGSYTTSATATTVNLGYEPQWILVKPATTTASWYVFDNMRGFSLSGSSSLKPNLADAEGTGVPIYPTSTGFVSDGAIAEGQTFIYIAIRRGPMKVPTSGTSVFAPISSNSSTGTQQTTNFPIDMQIFGWQDASVGINWSANDRLRGISSTTTESQRSLVTSSTAAESTGSSNQTRNWSNTGFQIPSVLGSVLGIYWNFKRAPSFFDEVCYTGNDVLRTINHNLGVAPEMMIIKCRDSALDWAVYHTGIGNTKYIFLNSTAASVTASSYWNDTSPTASVFTVNTSNKVNSSPSPYVAYLFATCAGVSKVGSYTGTGTTKQVDCGFTGGARFVLIKRTDSTGDWYVWDSARGIVAGNDPYLLLNSTAAEVTNTDYVDTYSAGFEISSTAPAAINASGGTFIFLAIA